MGFKSKINTVYRLSPRRKVLIPVTAFLSLYSVIALRFFKKNSVFGQMDAPLRDKDVDMRLVKDISAAIKIANKYAPWTAVCRHEAYQAKLLCRYFDIPYRIFVGFRKGESGQIEGHAWTVVNDTMITGFCKADDFVIQYTYSS